MNYGLQVITAPTAEATTLGAVADYLRADLSAESDHLSQLRTQAIEEIERYTGRALLQTGYRLTLADWPRGLPEFASYPRNTKGAYIRTIELPRSPATSIESVKYYAAGASDLSTLPPSNYIAVTAYEPGMVYLKEDYGWPELSARPDAVQIEFTAGHAALPATMKQALLLLCRFYYAGGSPNDAEGGGDDLGKAHLLLNKLRINGWSA